MSASSSPSATAIQIFQGQLWKEKVGDAVHTKRVDDLIDQMAFDRLPVTLLLDKFEDGRSELVLALHVAIEVLLPLNESELRSRAW